MNIIREYINFNNYFNENTINIGIENIFNERHLNKNYLDENLFNNLQNALIDDGIFVEAQIRFGDFYTSGEHANVGFVLSFNLGPDPKDVLETEICLFPEDDEYRISWIKTRNDVLHYPTLDLHQFIKYHKNVSEISLKLNHLNCFKKIAFNYLYNISYSK